MQGKTIVLGIGAGIAAYKVAELASRLTQAGASVHCVLTEAATRFVAPLTFQALTHNPALSSLWSESNTSGLAAGMPHIDLADRADLIIVAPATADVLARMAAGQADDLLTTLLLATAAPVWVAPAMNPRMLAHPATQANLNTLAARGVRIIDPETGRMACEHVGTGRLPETPVLLAAIEAFFAPDEPLSGALSGALQGRHVVVTAGPTREALDPVRYISNRSSGKMGYAVAAVAAARGARVTLVSGPSALPTPPGVERVDVTTALEMHAATVAAFTEADALVAAAAPADYRAAQSEPQKIKRQNKAELELKLVANPDIVAECGRMRRPGQVLVGFAAETGHPVAEAQRKLAAKGLDAVVANDVTQANAGFDIDTNLVTWVTASNAVEWPLASKTRVAELICDELALLLQAAEQ